MAKRRQIRNLVVDRVDAVDSPATGLKFLVFKSDDPVVLRERTSKINAALDALFGQLAQDQAFSASQETVDAINAVAKAAGVENFEVAIEKACGSSDAKGSKDKKRLKKDEAADTKDDPDDESDESEDDGEVSAAPATDTEAEVEADAGDAEELELSSDDLQALTAAVASSVKAQVGELLAPLEKRLAALEGTPVKRRVVIQQPSRQAEGQDQPVKKSVPEMGNGLFNDIVFGQ